VLFRCQDPLLQGHKHNHKLYIRIYPFVFPLLVKESS
jgi:hypothetical protein